MAQNTSLADRFKRAQANARRKKIAELEAKPSRKSKIAKLEAELKQANEKAKSDSWPEDDGKGKKPGAVASDKYDNKKVQPKPKGSKEESKLNRPSGETAGYPFKAKDVDNALGKGDPKDPKDQKQKALDKANDRRKDLTSETPALKKTPKPDVKAASTEDKSWRSKKIAELKRALSESELEDLNTDEVDLKNVQDMTGKASKEQRVPAAQVLQKAQQLIPALTQQLQQANDMLEDAVMGNNLQKIKGALAFLLTKIQEMTKSQIVPLGATIRKLMSGLKPKQASSAKFASLVQGNRMIAKFDDEFARSKHLMHQAVNRITL